MMFDVRNPATGEHISSLPVFSASDVSAAANLAAESAKSWENTAASVRAVKLVNAASLIRSRQDALASLLTHEQGKPLAESKSEIMGAAHVFETNRLVRSRRDGKQVFYSLDDEHVRSIILAGAEHLKE